MTIAYELEDRGASTRGVSGGPVVDAAGRLVAIHYRREPGSTLRRGLTSARIAAQPALLTFVQRTAVPGDDLLERLAKQYEGTRTKPRSLARTAVLDSLVQQMSVACAYAPLDTPAVLWRRDTLGARAGALAFCIQHPDIAPVDIIVEGIAAPRTAHEQWTALLALRRVVAERSPAYGEPAISLVVQKLGEHGGFGGDRSALARRVLETYLQRCSLSVSLADRLELVEEWLRAAARPGGDPCVAFVGGVASSPWKFGYLAEALGRELASLGWRVVAAAGREVGTRAIAGAQAAGAAAQLAHDGGALLLEGADCVIAMAGGLATAKEFELVRQRNLPVLALPFTGGVAEQQFEHACRELHAQGVPAELLVPLGAARGFPDIVPLVVRIAGVVLARARTRRREPLP
jgi:hypothetical protein